MPKQNIFLSPLSIFLALSMLEAGANGDTKAAIRSALSSTSNAGGDANEVGTIELMRWLRDHKGAELAIANALWTHVTADISPEFARICGDEFDAEARRIDFKQPAAAVEINAWVSEKTRGTIPVLVSPDRIDSALALITNAVYMKGKFREPFLEELTAPQPFHLSNGTNKVVPMMSRSRMADAYWHSEKCEAAEFRYSNTGVSIFLILPTKGLAPEEVLTQAYLSGMSLDKSPSGVVFKVPRFTMDFNSTLKETLTHMGMGIAFGSGADFSLIGSSSVFISDVVHKTHLEVDEQGTIASAATAIIEMEAAFYIDPPEPRWVVFDRPFAVLLGDQGSGVTLFAGVIYEP